MLSFILSSGRTGTVFINKVISDLPNISSCHERNGKIVRILSHIYLHYHNKLVKQIAIKMISNNLVNLESAIHIEINNMAKAFIGDVFNKFSDSNYIHIVRDPRSYVVSTVNWANNKIFSSFLRLNFPFWAPKPKHFSLGQDKQSRLFEIAVNNWKISNSHYLSLKNKTKKYYLLKFEDLVVDPVNFIMKILKISGYEQWDNRKLIQEAVKQAPKNESIKKVFPDWPNWDDKYALYLHKHCGDLMKEFGYGQEDEWRTRVYL